MQLEKLLYIVLMITVWWSFWNLSDLATNFFKKNKIITPLNFYILSFILAVLIIHKYQLDKTYE